ncbi:MAG: hypothetical protein IKD74_03000 [Clostridia bacterium]|jgi:hypothetical protein|nr:hypothetical protein [Clostridia bacterium]
MTKKKNIEIDIDLERKMVQNPSLNEYDYVYRLNNITSLDEQKIKVEELENITKKDKNDNKK